MYFEVSANYLFSKNEQNLLPNIISTRNIELYAILSMVGVLKLFFYLNYQCALKITTRT